jgi:hypothetical protein
MKLIFHIFWKDARHLWREIAVSLALLLVCAWSIPREWTDAGPGMVAATGLAAFSSGFLNGVFWSRLLVILLPVSWLFAVARAIQSDSLVGNRQFWLTRPYDWRQLLAAKCVFVLAFVNLPLLVLDLYLLAKAGFTPTHYMVGLLWMQLLIILILVIPIAALATVTTTVVQLLLSLLVLVLYLVGSSFLSERIPASKFTSTEPFPTILLIATPLAMIALQYARRHTTLSRWLILLPAVGLVLITLFAPYRTLISRQYAALQPGEHPPIQIALGKNLGTWGIGGHPDPKQVGILLPLVISRADPDSILVMEGSQVEVDEPNGSPWDAGWTSMNSMQILPGQNITNVQFAMPTGLYQQLRYSDARLRVTLAFTYFRDASRRTFVVPAGTFLLPGGALCSAPADDPTRTYGRPHALMCLAPLRRPASLYMTLKLNDSTCSLPENTTPLPDDSTGSAWVHSGESAELSIDPVAQVALMPLMYSNLYHPHELASSDHPHDPGWHASLGVNNSTFQYLHGICPGTPLTLSNPEKIRDMQMTQPFENVHLPDISKLPWR